MEVDSPEFQSDGYEDIFHTITQPEHNKQDEQSPEEVMDELDDEFFSLYRQTARMMVSQTLERSPVLLRQAPQGFTLL